MPILLFYGFAFIGIVHSLIFSFLAIKSKKTADLIITLFLFVQSLIVLQYVLYWTGLQQQYHYLSGFDITLLFLFGPLLFMYVDFILLENKKSSHYLIHFIPAIMVCVLMLPYFFGTPQLKLSQYKLIKYFVLDFDTMYSIIMVHMSAYVVALIIKIKKVKRVGHINNWMLTIVGLFAFYVACFIAYFIMVKYPWFNLTTDYFVSTGMCASIVSIIYFAYGKRKIMDGFPISESINLENIYFSYKNTETETTADKKKDQPLVYNYPVNVSNTKAAADTFLEAEHETKPEPVFEIISVKYKNSGLTTDAVNELAEILKLLMIKEKLYRESELKLEMLASRLGVAKHYVSQVINQHYGVNFFEYINLLRIEDAKQLLMLSDKKEMNIIEVAYTVGYNTKNTFNAAFRRIVGLTPTEFRNQNRIKMN